MAFVNGYISVMAMETKQVKVWMLNNLKEMMEDGEAYGWPAVHFYHVAWLQHLERCCAMFSNYAEPSFSIV